MRWGVSPTTVGRLRTYGAPYSLLLCVAYVASLSKIERNLDCLEVFSGAGELSAQFRALQMTAAEFEVNTNPLSEDILSDVGFLNAVHLVCSQLVACYVQSSALTIFVTVLLHQGIEGTPRRPRVGRSSLFQLLLDEPRIQWPQQGRFLLFLMVGTKIVEGLKPFHPGQARPCGDESKAAVILGNKCLVRFLLLVLLAMARNVMWVIENPAASIMREHPRMRAVAALCEAGLAPRMLLQRLWLGCFGHCSPKPLMLWGDASAPWIPLLLPWFPLTWKLFCAVE